MASNNPLDIMEDEEFDWEAAAREIDVVCQMTSDAQEKGKEKGKQQTTLDRFVSIANAKKESSIPTPTPQLEEDDENPTFVHHIDAEAAKTWIYPVNVPLRDYQFAITQSALFSNTLVALPTGLGKTLIAAVVMYNYFRWFPQGKIVFAAPSRPLVTQQIEACHNIVGIPQEWTVDMTGHLSPPKRAQLWKTKRVFFVTPQVLEKDIHSGTCLVKYLVCLVIDEAHRAMGNYAYCEAVRELMAVPVQLRILALTATPGSKQQTVQAVINNLHVSRLEYRGETDHDVISYVHNRKIELIQVAMGPEAVEINNMFMEVIRPIVARLTKIGVIQNRDYRTLSPCQLLEIRESFRQRLRQDLSHVNYEDVEGYFGVLITLYYIHKLLSSHGIRPAHEMLERKLKQGYFAKFMSKSEVILKARQLMQQTLFHGASSPKLSKMLEVLLEHFKTNDPQNSRVIIFSNYRESVRDIMNALEDIGELVRATEFIGQSSGKTMKGQSQKVQQAVLTVRILFSIRFTLLLCAYMVDQQKFRSGAYNVIVATSIGEEGLDIMEVDLVISFDANISPLRMIQRMGRTGRKHDGRVGSELKGYLRKEAKSKTISRHMRNGGINSFSFHPSPRMIPHVFKPEVQYVELSIEKFIPRQKNVKDDKLHISPSKGKLTVAEINLLETYFQPTGENICRTSLIAFPHFQTFPSRVHKVKHSSGTLMLIDMMQRLQGLASFPKDEETSSLQEDLCLGHSKPVTSTKLDKANMDNESCSRHAMRMSVASVNCLDLDSCHVGIQSKDFVDPTWEEETCEGDEAIPETPIFKRSVSNEGYNAGEMVNLMELETSSLVADACINGMKDEELSPRLTNLIKSGVVPESPIDERGKSGYHSVIRDYILPVSVHKEQNVSSLRSRETQMVDNDKGTDKDVCTYSVNETQSPLLDLKNCINRRGRVFLSQTEEGHMHNSDQSLSEEALPADCGEMSESIKPARRFKRLRKAEDTESNRDQKNNSTVNFLKSSYASNPAQYKHGRGKRKSTYNVRDFIEEEAEVSSDAYISNDEDGEDDNSFDSFIDDRTNPTAASQPEASRMDMMAIYRRSLLSQAPSKGGLDFPATFTPDRVTMAASTSESGDSSWNHFHTDPNKQSANRTLESVSIDQITSEAVFSSCCPMGNGTEIRSHKRRLSFYHSEHFPSMNLEQEFALQSKKEVEDVDATTDVLCDDEFYNELDLDELEVKATLLLKGKLDLSIQKQDTVSQSHSPNLDIFCSPSFDLGI